MSGTWPAVLEHGDDPGPGKDRSKPSMMFAVHVWVCCARKMALRASSERRQLGIGLAAAIPGPLRPAVNRGAMTSSRHHRLSVSATRRMLSPYLRNGRSMATGRKPIRTKARRTGRPPTRPADPVGGLCRRPAGGLADDHQQFDWVPVWALSSSKVRSLSAVNRSYVGCSTKSSVKAPLRMAEDGS